jgi:deoxyuridine 5'-triphosphate nucleotidohydrolase
MLADRLFGDLGRAEHAYALGVAVACGRLTAGGLELRLRGDGEPIFSLLRKHGAGDGVHLILRSERARTKVLISAGPSARNLLGTTDGSALNATLPPLRADLSLAFFRGLFDAGAKVTSPKSDKLVLRLSRPGPAILENLMQFAGIVPSELGDESVKWSGVAALDLLGLLYEPSKLSSPADGEVVSRFSETLPLERLVRPKMRERYLGWCARMLHVPPHPKDQGTLLVRRLRADAVLPSKGRVSDSGYDLTILSVVRSHGNIVLFGTGLSVEPPPGWYFDVIARSSLVKLGYMMANSVGVIDRAYRGEIMVPLLKVDPSAPDIVLPARVAQLIPRPIVHFPVVESAELTVTHRGSGGFGSSGPA